MGTSDLPDMYTQARGPLGPGARGYIHTLYHMCSLVHYMLFHRSMFWRMVVYKYTVETLRTTPPSILILLLECPRYSLLITSVSPIMLYHSQVLKDDVKSCIIDSEAVAWDTEKKQILPFQVLSTRKRKVCISCLCVLF